MFGPPPAPHCRPVPTLPEVSGSQGLTPDFSLRLVVKSQFLRAFVWQSFFFFFFNAHLRIFLKKLILERGEGGGGEREKKRKLRSEKHRSTGSLNMHPDRESDPPRCVHGCTGGAPTAEPRARAVAVVLAGNAAPADGTAGQTAGNSPGLGPTRWAPRPLRSPPCGHLQTLLPAPRVPLTETDLWP